MSDLIDKLSNNLQGNVQIKQNYIKKNDNL